MLRKACRAGSFYPRSEAGCREELSACMTEAVQDAEVPLEPVAAIVPHAGWVYSGRVAAGALRGLLARTTIPRLVVLFGAVHVPGVLEATLSEAEGWESPLGVVSVHDASRALLSDRFLVSDEAHVGEHSLEVEIPFIQELFPEAEILPIAVPPYESAVEVGREVAETLRSMGDEVVFVGSTDLSHYGVRFGFLEHGVGEKALRWVREENDARMIRLMVGMEAEKVVDEAWEHHNACGAGAIAATLAAARVHGRERGVLTGYTTSADVTGELDPTDFVGYAGVVF